ncbi:ankyrin [Pseudovirgaria hyperparasitica]|uniref:Ankyrin n=1 Tax=Pseudovirgaria hyperparasitica TaxID=470096 RepID=A0A6A6VTM6_9PEZI|nr:ankyrin [Pseudovirgaria hyperparasitica]KAF2753932.1 ankyrin [Pseudovirgaria hyperparasitica]
MSEPVAVAATQPALTEDDIDDILYLARTNDAAELSTTLAALAKTHATSIASVVSAAVDPDSKNTPLHYAAANGHVETVTALITPLASSPDKSPLNPRNSSLNTPLHWAALNGHLAAVQLLVQAGADAALVNAAGHDCVFEAELNNKEEVVEWLLREAVGLEQGFVGKAGDDKEDGGEEQEVEMTVKAGNTSTEVEVKMEGLNVNGTDKEEGEQG